ncbi:single-stranded DNA-binding protein [Citricoccus sp. GCM10030269]|uniref:single-stranded DNA-binding protein n=1 Tax=Citricoccus sp. GCM10030269 TaxID=3273388 RepID=UPI00361044D2
MSEHITVRGFVATDPSTRVAQAGFSVGNFRLAATDRRFDRERNAWVDGKTNWFTVNMFRSLALNAGASLQKGQPVVVSGRLKVRPWETDERSGTAVEIDAETIGHDLSLGTASFARSSSRSADSIESGHGPSSSSLEANVDQETGEVLDDADGDEGAEDVAELSEPDDVDGADSADRLVVA